MQESQSPTKPSKKVAKFSIAAKNRGEKRVKEINAALTTKLKELEQAGRKALREKKKKDRSEARAGQGVEVLRNP